MAFAERTKVPVHQTKGEIEQLVTSHGASAYGIMERQGRVQIGFELAGRNILFRMTLPEDPQERRSLWRALLLTIKGKLESAERGIESFEEAFLAHIVMPDGRTVGETTRPTIEDYYKGRTIVPLLPPA